MTLPIQDKAALSQLSVRNLHDYARSRNWSEQETWGDRAIVYSLGTGDVDLELLVPLRDSFADYAERVANIIATLAISEDRPELEVYFDLVEISSDVIRLSSSGRPDDHMLSLSEFSSLYAHSHELVTAAARAVETPKAAYRGNISKGVADYLSRLTPVRTSGSDYSLTLHSPVTRPLFEQRRIFDYHEEQNYMPFSRRTTMKLAEALQYTTTALSEVCLTSDLSVFDAASSYGVSANLCSSLSKLAKDASGIEIALFWALVRGDERPQEYRFGTNSIDILDDAAKELREAEPFLDHSFVAYVVRLEREPHEFDGRAIILADVDQTNRRLHVEFAESAFSQVIEAFQDRQQVSLVGDIRKKGRLLIAENPRHLRIMQDSDA